MSLAFLQGYASSGVTKEDIQNILVLLYKLVKLGKSASQYTEYKYDYNYIPPLAMTGAEPLPILKIKIPAQELPNLKWVLIVAIKLTTTLLNGVLSDVPSLLNDASHNHPITKKLQIIKEIDQQIQSADSRQELEKIALSLAVITQEIVVELKSSNLFNVSFDVTETSEIEEEIAEIDQEWELYRTTQNAGDVDFSPSIIEDAITDLLSSAVKEIIRANANLLELDTNQDLATEVDFSTQSSAAQPTLEDYNKLFKIIPLPPISQKFQEDLTFAYMQLAGPNPLMLQQVTKPENLLAISDEQYQQIINTSDSLAAAISEGRVYQADYSQLKDMKNGNFPSQQKYIYAPVALFAVPPAHNLSRSLVPIAIQCQPESPVFTPLSGENWLLAKSVVQMADSNYHEIVSHLGRTHLFIEPFVIATRRQLPKTHHLRILLEPHLEGTVLINYGAHQKLIANGGGVDKLLASTIESDRALAVKGAQDYLHNFNAAMFPNILASRGVDNVNQLPEYPYRDDGILIWNAVYKWVQTYLNSYYTNLPLIEDTAIQNWAKELVSQQGGRLQNFGEDASGAIKTLDYLTNVVTTIIFTASAQHAAVNFAQGELMLYAPAFPLAGYSPAPTSAEEQSDFMKFIPPIAQAKAQINLTYLLGSVYYTRLGQYSNSYFNHQPQIKSALLTFQQELIGIEAEINRRNSLNPSRILPYKFLLPSQIPQSINI